MFTGIVEELGTVAALDRTDSAARLSIEAPEVTSDAREGDSIAVNGVCLTVTEFAAGRFAADLMLETLQRSSLGDLQPGSRVNLERAATLSTRLGGHLVQGHVDATAPVRHRHRSENWEIVTIGLPPPLARYIVAKGSIAVDGVSLTVAEVDDQSFRVSLIPTTLQRTTLGIKQPGEPVNLEVDVIAKYVEKLISGGQS